MEGLKPMVRIGVIDLDRGAWTGGGTYSDVTVKSLISAQSSRSSNDEVYFLSENREVSGARRAHGINGARSGIGRLLARSGATWAGVLRGREERIRRALRLPGPDDPAWLARRNNLDVIFPVLSARRIAPRGVARLGWIPDFQHVSHPQLFTSAQLGQRHRIGQLIAERCDAVVLSSQTVLDQFCELYPHNAGKARMLPFPSRFAFESPETEPGDMVRAYCLPERYLLCANQIWAHKNHLLLVDALSLLRAKGKNVHCVMTGLPLDSRSPTNEPTSTLLQAIAKNDLRDQVSLLGLVPRSHLDGLLRGAVGVVQPSSHEGWSTTVQDAKALGRPIICSDLPVLREQLGDAMFFDLTVTSLADVLLQVWESGSTGSIEAEAECLALEREFAAEHGRRLMSLCEEVVHR
jgi:glycosyltransferase involved in cell wall biosynthesis